MDCFRAWLGSKKLEQYNNGVLSLFWEELKCDICKSDLNLTQITLGDNRTLHYLLGIQAPKGNKYIILESDTECQTKAVHIIDFSVKLNYNVGRRVTNDICVSDITVSRMQANIRMKEGKIYLYDSNSKFGTFVMIQGLYKINFALRHRHAIHIERKCFFFQIQDCMSLSQRCFKCLG